MRESTVVAIVISSVMAMLAIAAVAFSYADAAKAKADGPVKVEIVKACADANQPVNCYNELYGAASRDE